MDIVYIQDLKIETVIGLYDWEREIKQVVSLSLEMAHDIRQAAATDEIEYALDYNTVAQRLISFIKESEFLLLETMAEHCAEIIMADFSVPWVRLQLSKPGAVREAKDVGLIIERGKKT